MENLLYWAGISAVAVNALTASSLPSQEYGPDRRNDGGAATALGGCTVRDVLLQRPVFLISDQST